MASSNPNLTPPAASAKTNKGDLPGAGAGSATSSEAAAGPEQVRMLSALAVAGIEAILREVSEGEIDNQKALKKIQALLEDHGKNHTLSLF